MRQLLFLLAFIAAPALADNLRPPLLLTGQRADVLDLQGASFPWRTISGRDSALTSG